MSGQGESVLAWLNTVIAIRSNAAQRALKGRSGRWCSGTSSDNRYADEWELESHVVYEDELDIVVVSNDVHPSKDQSVHIALNDPESVLRRCAADRKLLELHGGRGHSCLADGTGHLDEWMQFAPGDACPVILILAEGYGWTGGHR
ncbi:DUF6221 family protein [Streptomyces sp. NRRL F-5135]|uniref:DUF6221 family protein n=1 Tax=Streptomyces sp. NRRL F-5135 TaxID=1463858 RepID=UPI0004C7EDF5|nr:DUF6221 family protein [Streptomyces sp. NRRL F-5135]